MADPDRPSRSGEESDRRPGATGTARWVVVLGIVIAAALVGLVVFLHLAGTLGPSIH